MTEALTAEQEVRHLDDVEVDAFLHRDPALEAKKSSGAGRCRSRARRKIFASPPCGCVKLDVGRRSSGTRTWFRHGRACARTVHYRGWFVARGASFALR